jgi:hypothetical protein
MRKINVLPLALLAVAALGACSLGKVPNVSPESIASVTPGYCATTKAIAADFEKYGKGAGFARTPAEAPAVLKFLESSLANLEKSNTVAPPDLKLDYGDLIKYLRKSVPALRAAGTDLAKLTQLAPSQAEGVVVQQAAQRISEFDQTWCPKQNPRATPTA